MMHEPHTQVDRVEALLRAAGAAPLKPQFRRGVLDAVAALPDPDLLAASGPRVPPLALALFALLALSGAALTLLPGGATWLAAWHWELSDLSVALSVGGSVFSASLLSLLAVGLGAAFMTAVGVYSARHRLIGA